MKDTHDHPLLSVTDLGVAFGDTPVIENLSFTVPHGKTVAVVGESGSGKSVTSLSIMRLADIAGAHYTSGKIMFASADGQIDLLSIDQDKARAIRGNQISMIFQEPMTSLNPVFTIGDQICEVLMLHAALDKPAALAEAERLLSLVRLPDAKGMLRRYPHHLSGGMRQRVMIAMALACRPKLLIADEPTTALDVTIQAQILTILRDLQAEFGMSIVFITHDMGVVAEIADEVVVMWKGKKVEEGPVAEIFANPQHPYTRTLLSAVPRLGQMTGEPLPLRLPLTVLEDGAPKLVGERRQQDTARRDGAPLIDVQNLSVSFTLKKNWLGRTTHYCPAVTNTSFQIYPGETLALVGESGSGKSTIARTIMQLTPPTTGDVLFDQQPMSKMPLAQRQALRRDIQYIFQDPFASLDPRKTVGWSIAEPLRTHGLLDNDKAIVQRVGELLERVGLPASVATRYPHQFSGGQRQRVCIARALASRPRLIIADESLSALDVSIQAQVINLFMDLQKDEGLAYLFVSHDMAVVEKMSHRVAVLYLGQIVEIGTRAQVFENPQHPYTRRLLSAVPIADPTVRPDRKALEGEIPSTMRVVGDAPTPAIYDEVAPGHLVARH
ncbi:Glutathione import ATP-binding protein gsiA (plasmid) [Ketogulonicigenium robustum]|uniref:Glutathione import ATP-binding protein GsiA n=1 Tax=Ketogulonicigenium robustum TaxID=92947 RepID=A0A1W6P3A2_9RHOB|nr:ABC transporter ATP-binding protein [Ketogulonicigenium robustum]ARO15988.1 Glutathione import ATP-binding protein gsiA [Ketogulonicigenium robustum]